jgi:UDP-N-acetylmuramoylalanine--D-glutamate ligase
MAFSEQCTKLGLVQSGASHYEPTNQSSSGTGQVETIGEAGSTVTRGEYYWILEVSSFQLDHIHTFCPNVSVLLNITPDHLDRYNHSMDDYSASKFRITQQQSAGQTFIYNYDDLRVRSHAQQLLGQSDAPRLWAFSTQEAVVEGAFLHNNQIIFRLNNHEEILMSPFELGLQGQHNLQNGLATALAARACEIKNEVIRESLSRFTGVEHRLEVVRELDGIKYINDSKATNVNAVWFALDSIKTPMTLILGGRDKGNDYTELRDQLLEKVHTVIAIGESRDRIQEQIGDMVPHFIVADDMRTAVRSAQKQAKRGEVVLLSPACSSFDMFDNYEHRGRAFKECVQHLS